MKIGQRLLSIAANSRNGLVPFERTRTQTIFWGGLPVSPQADFGEISLKLIRSHGTKKRRPMRFEQPAKSAI